MMGFKHPSYFLQVFFIKLLKSREYKDLVRPQDTGSMHSLVPGLVRRQIRSSKSLLYDNIQGHNKASILILLLINIILLSCVGPGDVFIITNVGIIFILGFGPKCLFFIIDEGI